MEERSYESGNTIWKNHAARAGMEDKWLYVKNVKAACFDKTLPQVCRRCAATDKECLAFGYRQTII